MDHFDRTCEGKLDAGETIFFRRQLEHVKARSFDIKFPALKARQLFPVSGEAGPGAESITYEQFDMVGLAKIIASYADDLPRADIRGKEFVSLVKGVGSSYGYSIQDVRAAAHAGKPLTQRKANAARRAMEQEIHNLALFGNTTFLLPGFFGNASIPLATVPADGTGSVTFWSAKTAEQILRDMNAVVNDIVELTKGVEIPDILLLPLEQFNLVSTKRVGTDNTSETILSYFLKTNPYIQTVDWLNELDAVSDSMPSGDPGDLDVMCAYRRDPDALSLEIPQDIEFLPIQETNLEFKIPVHARHGGVLIYYPLSIGFAEGI